LILSATIALAACQSSKRIQSATEERSSAQTLEEKTLNASESIGICVRESVQVNQEVFFYSREYYPPALGDTLPPALKSEQWKGVRKKEETGKKTDSRQDITCETNITSAQSTDTKIIRSREEKRETKPLPALKGIWIALALTGSGCILFEIWKNKHK